ncbi:glycosyltransferase [Streptomyces liliifuscus]|uniref:Glycosyltransferase n=1 Tax=Streptomyces liliifuscus TaxID=2797636 RepID=A0A7T7L4P3_9ACTN|nr:glycosyltransferase [Streptomyces liliifuscus]QQM46402.1 glycosyltransferase [Streptomyces liliifuscus]
MLAAVLAVLGACCYAVGAKLQHEAVRPRRGDASASPSLRVLVRCPRWWAGLAVLGVATALHVGALWLAPVTVVQPLGVTAVLVSAVWGLRARRAHLTTTMGLALVAVVAGAGMFALLAARVTEPTQVTAAAQLWAGLLVSLAVLGCSGLAVLLRGRGRFLVQAVGAGIAYGCMPVLIRAASEEFTSNGVSAALGGTLGGLTLAGLAGCWLSQRALAAGPPEVTLACLTVVDPFVAVVLGVGVLGEAPGLSLATVVAGLACWTLAVVGVLQLSRATPFPHLTPGRQSPGRSSTRQEYVMHNAHPRPQTIVIGADTFPPDVNGAANFAQRLAEGLSGRGHDVHVICPATEAGAGTIMEKGITVHRLASHRTPFHPTFRVCLPWQVARSTARLLEVIRPDVVHIQSHFGVCRSLATAARRRGIPVVATNHFMPENLLGYTRLPARLAGAACRFAWRDLVRVFHRARVVTAPTPRAVQLLHDNGLASPAQAVSCGLDLERFAQPTKNHDEAGTRVLFVGRLDEEKNVHELLHALALLPRHLDVRGEIVGKGSCRRALEDLADELGIRDRVTFHGLVSDQEVLDAYARCDIFCMPGTAELQSLATLEAMAAGKPVVAADAMALPHLVHPGRNGYLFPPGDVRALADRLMELLDDPAARRRMGEAGREIVTEHDIHRTLATFEALYLHAAGHPAAKTTLPLPLPTSAMESEHDEYAARSGRR